MSIFYLILLNTTHHYPALLRRESNQYGEHTNQCNCSIITEEVEVLIFLGGRKQIGLNLIEIGLYWIQNPCALGEMWLFFQRRFGPMAFGRISAFGTLNAYRLGFVAFHSTNPMSICQFEFLGESLFEVINRSNFSIYHHTFWMSRR